MNTATPDCSTARWAALALVAGLLLPLPARAQSAACLNDPHRQAQLAELDAAQLYDLQHQHGAREVTRRTERIFERLVAALVVHEPDALAIDWRLVAYGSLSLNAHAMHSGRIVITQGLDSPHLPEALVAASLAHEMAHVLMRHGLVQACFALEIVDPSATGRQAQTALMDETSLPVLDLARRVRSLTHSHELQADAKAVELLRQAGFPRHALSQLLAFLAARQKPLPDASSGSHPDHQLRIAKAREAESRPLRVQR